jgi:hypothetical protein
MKAKYLGLAALLFGAGLASADGILPRHHSSTPPVCEPGYKIVEETVMQDCVRLVCKQVCEPKKKWVYQQIDDPFCIRDSHHGHGSCENCAGPKCRKLLVKVQVDDGMTTKCVVETIVDKVPVKVYRKVPCDAPNVVAPLAPSAPLAAPLPPGTKK